MSDRHAESWQELHVGDSHSLLSLCSESQVSLWACSPHPAPSPTNVPRGVRCTGCSIQQPPGEGTPHFPPLPSWGFSESKKCTPCPRTLLLVHRQGVCMPVHAAGVGAMSVCPFPSALLLPSDCDHCPCCLLSWPPPSTPSPKVLVKPAARFVRFLCRINICICSGCSGTYYVRADSKF